MTVRLDTIMKFRDMQVAEDVGKMAELGWFDKEFTMYGCAYLIEGQAHYMISSEAEKIHEFIHESHNQNLYPTPIMMLNKTCPVPSGRQEDIANHVKVELARNLRNAYPKAFLEMVLFYANQENTDAAKETLLAIKHRLEGLFVEEKLHIFEGLLQLAYDGKVLSKMRYDQFKAWLKAVRKEMEDDVIVKDIFERTFYGFAYEDQGNKINYYFNAQKESAYSQQNRLEEEGLLTTPIFAKTYWYNYTYRLADAKADFEQYLSQVLDQSYLETVKGIRALPTAINEDKFCNHLQQIGSDYGELAKKAFLEYGRRWHILK